jgi:multidrug efflux pump subunit AcrB
MKWLTSWFLDNPVAANLLMAFILVAGYLTTSNIRVESFPQIEPSQLSITVVYPGGTPEQIDSSITQRIENAISGVAGIKSVMSASYAGYAEITVRKSAGTDLDKLVDNVRNQVESIVGFPEKAERPRIVPDEFGNLASFIIVHGDVDESTLQQATNQVQKALKNHPQISKITNLGKKKSQLSIRPDPQKLQHYGVSPHSLAEQITQWSLEYRSGELNTESGRITLRGDGFADDLTRLANLPIITSAQGTLTLHDIAEVTRTHEKDDSIVRFAGKQAVALMISTSKKDNLLNVSDATKDVLRDIQPLLPDSIETTVMADMAPYITEQLDLLSNNAIQGLLIVLVILGIFLDLRLAFWVALGIPVSLAGAVWLMDLPQFNSSINDITLFGMILVLGILVDDAVVVGESIHNARKTYRDPKQAAWQGVNAVSTATTFGVLTTIAAFSPMLWIENELAKTLAGFSAVVIFALIFSLIESKLILPSHLSFASQEKSASNLISRLFAGLREYCQQGLQLFSQNVFEPTLKLSLRHQFTTLLLFSSIMLIAWGGLAKGTIPAVFFPEIPGRYGTATVTMDQDASPTLTNRNAMQMELAITATNERLQNEFAFDQPVVTKSLVAVDGGKKIEATIEFSKAALQGIPSQSILDVWKQETGYLEGHYSLNFTLADEPAGGTALAISANSRDIAKQVADHLIEHLKPLPGVENPFDDSQAGHRQLSVTLNERGQQLGLTQRDLAVLVGGAFGEIELHRLLDDTEEISVVVVLPEQQRKSISQLKSTGVVLPNGGFASLGEVSDIQYSRTPEVLYRRNRDEVITIQWRHNRDISSPESVWQALQTNVVPALLLQYPGVKVTPVGEFSEITEVQSGFKEALLMTLFLIYVLLAIPLKSYFQPLIIMSVIPFGFAGAVLGHAVMDVSVSILSLFGMMAMTGVVVNDSLVLMTRFNQLHRKGMPLFDALFEAGKSRMKAIFLTTVTTVCGLLPLLMETSETAQYLKPAAISLVFGELLATPITLILIPVLLGLGKKLKLTTSTKLTN